MSTILTIDTSTRWAGVGLFGVDEPVEITWRSNQNHGAELMDQILTAMQKRNVELRDIDVLAVAVGPGGFSALRVGLATAKGLVAAGSQSLIGVSTFEIEAAAHWPSGAPLAAMIDAGSSGIAWSLYAAPRSATSDLSALKRIDYGLCAPEQLPATVPETTLFCGESAQNLGDLVDESRILSRELPTRLPRYLAALADERVSKNEIDDPISLEPDYARPPSITSPKS